MTLEQARAIVDAVLAAAPGPVSVFVADDHGELVAAATMDGAAHDTRLNAQRKAYTAARSDQTTTSALAAKVATQSCRAGELRPVLQLLQGRRGRARGRAAGRRRRGQRAPGRGGRAARAGGDRRGRPHGRMTALVGLDVGTTGVKALALAPDGEILARAEADYPLSTPRPGWAEQDPRTGGARPSRRSPRWASATSPASASPGRCTASSCWTSASASSARRSSGTTGAPAPSATSSRSGSAGGGGSWS